MAKILKNTTANPILIADTGVSLPTSPGSYVIPPEDYLLWAASSNIITHIGSEDVLVNDGSSDLSISAGVDLIKGIFPSKVGVLSGTDGGEIGRVDDSLKVSATIVQSPGATPSVDYKLRYLDMNASTGGVARLTSIGDTAWVDLFTYSGSGILLSFLLNLEDVKNWRVRLVIDGEEIFSPEALLDDYTNDSVYDLDDAGAKLSPNEAYIGTSIEEHDRFVWSCPSAHPVRYSSSITIKVRRATGEASKKFRAGLIVLTKET